MLIGAFYTSKTFSVVGGGGHWGSLLSSPIILSLLPF